MDMNQRTRLDSRTANGGRRRKFDPTKHCGRKANDGNPCTLAKGYGTMHLNEGACKFHGGGSKTKRVGRRPVHGLYARVNNERLAEAIARVRREVEDPKDLLPEVEALRALALDFMERYGEFRDGLITFQKSFDPAVATLLVTNDPGEHAKAIVALRAAVNVRPREIIDVSHASVILDRVGRMVERIHTIEQRQSLTPQKVAEYRDALVLAVMRHCDSGTALKIAEDLENL